MKALLLATISLVSSGCVLLDTLHGRPPVLEAPPRDLAPSGPRLEDVRGIVHCHSFLSHDSKGSFHDIAASAREAGVRWIAMTDHFTPKAVSEGERGARRGVLFFTGAELSLGGGSILALALGEARPVRPNLPPVQGFSDDTQAAVEEIRAYGGLVFIGHAEEFALWDLVHYDGLEVFNLHAAASRQRWWTYLLSGLFETPPDFFTRMIRRPDDVLARWDALGAGRRVSGVGGCDCHASVRLFGPLGGTIGKYTECFRAVTTHVLVPSATAGEILESLRQGRAYAAFEIAGDATGFGFDLVAGARHVASMGEAVAFRAGLELAVRAPGGQRARLVLLRDGVPMCDAPGGALEVPVDEPGVYRVEVLLDGSRPFIYSNPIYIRPG